VRAIEKLDRLRSTMAVNVLITNLTHFFNVFISLLYMFWATQCSSSGESIVSTHHLVYITLCRWLSGMQVREELLMSTGLLKTC